MCVSFVSPFEPIKPEAGTLTRLLDRLGIDWGTGAAGEVQRGRREEELVDAVGGAVFGEFLQIEDLTHRDADRRDHHPVPGLVRLAGFVGSDFATPSIAADRRDVLVLQPETSFERKTRGWAAGVARPVARRETPFLMPGPDVHEIAFTDLDALCLGAVVEIGDGDGITIVERRNALEARDVEQHASSDHLVANMLDAELLRAPHIDEPRVVPVVHFIVEEDMAERVPL